MNKTTPLAFILFVVLVSGFVSVNMIEYSNGIYKNEINVLLRKNLELRNKLDEFYKHCIKVNVTMYRPTKYETDSTPNITADGTKIKIQKASKYNFVAVSRNLLVRWGGFLNYGDFILLEDAGHKEGVYQVRDTMNPRWVNVVDILESPGTKPYKFANAQIFKLPWTNKKEEISYNEINK